MGEFIILVVLLMLSGIFSGSETALVALSMGRVQALVKEGRIGSAALYTLKKDPSQMLTTILIGNNLVNIAASALATVIATREFGSIGPGIAVGLLTFFILVFGEITPKSLATRRCWHLCA
jgi:putative hemolysin